MTEKNEKEKMMFIQSKEKKLDRTSKAFDDFKAAFSQLNTDMQRLKRSGEEFNEKIKTFNEPEFLSKQYDDFKKKFNEQELMRKQIQRLSRKYDRDYRSEIFELFDDVFDNVRSKNHGLCKLPGQSWEVTCGKKGFARRDNVQAQDLRERDMWKILDHAELVAEKLEENNMELQAKQLRLFAENVPDLNDGLSNSSTPVIELENPVSFSTSDWRTDECEPLLGTHIRVNSNSMNLYSNYEYEEEDEDGEMQTVRNGSQTQNVSFDMHRSFDVHKAIAWMQLAPQIDTVFEQTTQFCKEQADTIDTSKKKLKKEFAKWVMMKQL